MTLAERIAELVERHGSLRAAARVLDVDHVYLCRLASGEKVNPGSTILRRMGLRRVVTYERYPAQRSESSAAGSGMETKHDE